MRKTTLIFDHDHAIDVLLGRMGERFGGAEMKIARFVSIVREMDDYRIVFETDRDSSTWSVPGVDFIPRAVLGLERPTYETVAYLESAPRLLLGRIARPLRRFRYRLAEHAYRARMARGLGAKRGEPRPIRFETIATPKSIDAYLRARAADHRFLWSMSSDGDLDALRIPTHLGALYERMIAEADGIIAQKESQADALASRGVVSTIIPNVVEVREPFIGGARDHVLWVGRAAALKRPMLALEAARRLPGVDFRIVALPDDSGITRELESVAATLPNVTLIPGFEPVEARAAMREAALLIGTSSTEGFPNVYLEAAAEMTPVVSLEVETSALEGEPGCGFNADGDFDAFIDRIEMWMADPVTREVAAATAHDYVMRVHSVEAVAPLLQRFLREEVDRP